MRSILSFLSSGKTVLVKKDPTCLQLSSAPKSVRILRMLYSLLYLRLKTSSLSVIVRKHISIEFFLTGDMMFLNLAMGLDSCPSVYSCVWRKCSRSDRWDSSKNWSMTNPDQGARTASTICEMAGKKRNMYDCSFPPILSSIPVAHVVMDNLHLFLRIADQLVSQLTKYLGLLDNIKSTSVYSPLKHLHMAKLEAFVVNSMGREGIFM